MCTQNEVNEILNTFANQIKTVFKDSLKDVILFGSYARGDYDSGSDIDVMVLVDIDKLEIKKYRHDVLDIVGKLDLAYDVVLSPIIQNYDEFERYKNDLPFFYNVEHEGVKISA